MLRYDDRGVGGSTGDSTTANPADRVTDAASALTYLRERKEIDPEQIGVLGHSEGGTVAAMLAQESPNIAFVIVMAAPTVDSKTLSRDALAQLEASGSVEQADQVARQEQRAAELALAADWEALEEYLYEITLAQVRSLPEEGQETLGDLEALARREAEKAVVETYQNPRYLFNLRYDPAQTWAQIDIPVLALYAELDDIVTDETNCPALENALAEAGNEDVTILLVPGVNHLFLEAETADPSAWANLPGNLPANVIEIIVDWVLSHVDVPA